MDPHQLVGDYLAEAEAATPGLAIAERDPAECSWSAHLGDALNAAIAFDPAGERVLFEVPVCGVFAAERPRVYELLLRYNALWRQTGGARMALDGAQGEVVLMFEIALSVLNGPLIATALRGLAEIRLAWFAILQAAGAGASTTRLPGSDPLDYA